MESIATSTTNETTVRLAVGISLVSLFLSGWSFVSSIDEDGFERSVEQRLEAVPRVAGAERLRHRRSVGARRGRVRTAGGRVPRVPS